MTWTDYPDRGSLAHDLAELLAKRLTAALQTKDRVTFAVPGGTSPGPVFEALAQVDLPWDRVNVILTDERWVPESSDRSNTALLRRSLLQGPASKATLIPLRADTQTPEESLDALGAQVASVLPIDVMLIGMGADMHTASLFPGADRLTDALSSDARPLMPMRAPGAPEPRITLTAPVLAGALDIHLLIMGDAKKQAARQAATLKPIDAPVACLLDRAHVHYAD